MVEIICKNKWTLNDAEKNWHYISWTPYSISSISGYASMSWVYAICMENLNLGEKELCALFHQIDSKGETGTFYPTASITILPSRRYIVYSPEEKKIQFCDAEESQKMIKADNIYWDCRFEDKKTIEAIHCMLLLDQGIWSGKKNYIICHERQL